MHLTLIISSLGSGGAEKVLTNLANHWVEVGHKVSLVTLASAAKKPFYPLDSRVELIQLDKNDPLGRSVFIRLRNIIERILTLRKTLKELNPEVIVSFIDIMNITTLLASWNLTIPAIISERIDPAYHPLPKLYKWLRFKIYPLATKLVVQTTATASYFPESIQNIIKIIPNSVPLPSRFYAFNQRVRHIISVGRLHPQKDHKTLIHAFHKLVDINPHLELTIYGEGPERSNLELLINSLKLKGKVHLPGTVKDIQSTLNQGDLFIFPSLYEGFPNALCEAMATGLPVIASNCSGNTDVVQDGVNGRLFPIGDVQALTDICEELIKNNQQRELLATHARKIVESFSSERIFSLWDKIIFNTQQPQ